mmetsp:Transcript_42137/g.86128  ORF Transcript_42137/g.86128 Transcript_42137/m.86128 type:complete len:594 (-) Transcript_42137:276-2057(-)|eukprot:CAMPEP_0181294738 /NCGR_PEP_ID=MMETSP1101-20121128/3768_1 /TAXON_ID=46948 /ORGANISM="Rhodomonas abbreviata, Strain Caron Lab Isolate" /LENGTH=593 /DNA_ID=CAMNT_0023399431 /DNA_START=123 /DNA_END=1904 /DNA_ORIENTATION=+
MKRAADGSSAGGSEPKRTCSEAREKMKYVVVTGGIMSGLGKGITASSIAVLLQGCGWKVNMIKIDPYLNVDAGTMSPFEHGETFVLDDGGETDLDLGNYERFLDISLSADNNITTGKIYQAVIERERKGEYLGKTVQVVPHITNAIGDWIERVATRPVKSGTNPLDEGAEADICVIELGGTVGDIESMPFIEGLRQLQYRIGSENMFIVQVTLVPTMSEEQKTKPTQHAVKELRSAGFAPNMICCRCETELQEEQKKKLGLFCQVEKECIISVHNVSEIYKVPLLLKQQNVAEILANQLRMYLPKGMPNISPWEQLCKRLDSLDKTVKIALVGKYTSGTDAYLSVVRALQHASMAVSRKLEILWVIAEHLEDAATPEEAKTAMDQLEAADGILVPGGFGDRGITGKVNACKYAREKKKPFLGVCLGMQVAVIEVARNILGWKDADSEEFTKDSKNPVIIFMPEGSKTHMGGTMRLGTRRTILKDDKCITAKLYKGASVDERHRHRYEVNPAKIKDLEKAGLKFVGMDETGQRMEIVELQDETHPYFVAAQFHPEFKSRVMVPAPLFHGLLRTSSGQGISDDPDHPQTPRKKKK